MQKRLLKSESAVAMRQPKTDRLFLARYVDDARGAAFIDEGKLSAAHAIVIRWAELETAGRLTKLNETQLQGDFLSEIFGQVLGYHRAVENEPTWHLEQHLTIDGKTPDAVLGNFGQDRPKRPLVVIELKPSTTHLDRDRSNGRTAVDQCWDYLIDRPRECRWGIVSNLVSFRLYERDSTKRAYEHFTLQLLRDPKEFRKFYAIFHRKGLIEATAGQPPLAVSLLEKTSNRQRTVSEELYDTYSRNRTDLVAHLRFDLGYPIDQAIETAQRLFDRIMFVAFCEDRQLLPEETIAATAKVAGFYAVTNPRWQNFKNLFRFIDKGNPTHGIQQWNGGLFEPHAVDDLELPDEPWARVFQSIAGYDFADEVNLDVLGHLFERSITELEKLKATGIFGDAEKAERYATMPQSAKRKQLGVYYTPPELTSRIVQYTAEELIVERFAELATEFGISKAEARRGVMPDDEKYWRGCLAILRKLKIVDPACGSGAFLFQAYNVLEQRYLEVIGHLDQLGAHDADQLSEQMPHFILQENLYGVDLSPEAVEITQLALWIRSATPGQTLATLSRNIVHGNSLVHDPAEHPHGFDWRTRFPEVFEREECGFDCVIGNPPWERIKLQEREFFSLSAPEIATATNAAKRRALVGRLEADDPSLYGRYQQAQRSADSLLTYCRTSNEYPLTGQGDINLYAVFAELAYQLVAPHGRVGLLTPSGIASDKTTKDFFVAVAESSRLIRLYDFENRTKKFFPDVDGRFKFCILNFGGSATSHKAADFAFFIHDVEELDDKQRHIPLSGDDIRLLNPNTRTCPIFRTRRDAEITKAIYRRVPVLVDCNREGPTGNPWGVEPKRKFDQDSKAEWFRETVELKTEGFKFGQNRWTKGKKSYLPLYEAKMVQAFDHRAAVAVTDATNWVRQGQKIESTVVQHQNPEYIGQARYWIDEYNVSLEMGALRREFYIAFKKITSATNTRTMIAAFIPDCAPVDSLPFLSFTDTTECRSTICLLANLNSIVYDFVARQKVQGNHLQHYHVEQLPTLSPDTYDKPCPWSRKKMTLEAWISERVLKLSCTAEDMLPLAEASDFNSGSFQAEYSGRLNKWDEAERAQLMAELDAAYFHLYGIERDDAEYILSTFKGIHDRSSLFADGQSTAERILRLYDQFGA